MEPGPRAHRSSKRDTTQAPEPMQLARILNLVFVRGKRTKAGAPAGAAALQRVVTQLSVLSASRKQPKRLKLAKEDLIKHQTVERAWRLFQARRASARAHQLRSQHDAIAEAMRTLRELDPALYSRTCAAARDIPARDALFPLDLKTPTDFPPRTLWHYKFTRPHQP